MLVVVVLEVDVVVLVVVGAPVTLIFIKLVHTPVDLTCTIDVKFGTTVDVYPATNANLLTLVANAVKNPSMFEYKLNGPVSDPAVVNVINTVICFGFNK